MLTLTSLLLDPVLFVLEELPFEPDELPELEVFDEQYVSQSLNVLKVAPESTGSQPLLQSYPLSHEYKPQRTKMEKMACFIEYDLVYEMHSLKL